VQYLIVQTLRRLTYWQWAKIGIALLVVVTAVESWRLYRRSLAIRNLSSVANLRTDEIGPFWLRSRVPRWVCETVLVTPRSVLLTCRADDAEKTLVEVSHLPTIQSLQLYSSRQSSNLSTHQRGQWNRTLRQIGRLTQLTELSLSIELDDDDLRELCGLSQLQRLHLDRDHLTAHGLRGLVPLRSLRDVSLSNATDDSLAVLAQLPNLEVLNLRGTAITDDGLKHLRGHRRLRSLLLGSTNVTDHGAILLLSLPALEIVDLQQTKITDAGAASLSQIRQLQHLNLSGTAITDASIPHLIKIPQLKGLGMVGSRVTDEGFMQFARACPEVTLRLPIR
jgi:Leucine-rich repeat (LRR) protein